MRTLYRSRNTLDEYRLSSLERSAESTRAMGTAQAMKSSDPLLEGWEKTLARRRDAVAIFATSGKGLRTFGEIEQRTRDFLQGMDVFREGDVLGVQIGNHEDWPAILLGCLRRHLAILPLEPSISEQQRREALEICKATAVVSAVPSEGSPEIVRLKTARTTPDWGENPPNLLTPLIARGVPLVISRDRTPRAILADLARSNATVFPGMPVFYQAFCEMEHVPGLSKLRLCISAGAPLSIAVAKKFRGKFNLPIHSFYGASECGGICYDRKATNTSEGFVGEAMKGVNLEMVDPKGSATQIRVHSAAVGDGYFPEPDKEKLGHGIFVPDDLLTRHGSGFKMVGRISDVINVAGKKVNPAEVEAHLLRFTGVRQAVVFGRPADAGALRNEEVAACVVTAPDVSETDLLQFCRGALSTWQVPKRIFIVDAIPANERGKISRRGLSRRFSTNRERSSLP